MFTSEIAPRLAELSDEAVLAIYHRQQRHAWSVNIIDGIAMGLERAGPHQRAQTTPAMCSLDITGYTRLTQERGDRAAADFAEQVRRLVERPAIAHGGRAVKWLGDGVMSYFATAQTSGPSKIESSPLAPTDTLRTFGFMDTIGEADRVPVSTIFVGSSPATTQEETPGVSGTASSQA